MNPGQMTQRKLQSVSSNRFDFVLIGSLFVKSIMANTHTRINKSNQINKTNKNTTKQNKTQTKQTQTRQNQNKAKGKQKKTKHKTKTKKYQVITFASILLLQKHKLQPLPS